jgi:hypothetical protein
MDAMKHIPTGRRILWDGHRLAWDLDTKERVFLDTNELEHDPTWCAGCGAGLLPAKVHRCPKARTQMQQTLG